MPYWFDGNNLIGQSAAVARQEAKTRQSFLMQLSDYATARGGRFLVYFDGDDCDRSVMPRGVRVRYSAPLSTDDAILRDLEGARLPAEIIVVTNDNGLTARCRCAGVRTMNWSQFTLKMVASPQRPNRAAHKKDEEIDLDDWSRYFGFDPEKLDHEFRLQQPADKSKPGSGIRNRRK